MSEDIYKVTLYMTKSQWEEMSSMNALQGKPNWVGLYHEGVQNEEYQKHLSRFQIQSSDSDSEDIECEPTQLQPMEVLAKFDPRSMHIDHTLIIGKRSTGKTYLAKDIIKHTGISTGIVITPHRQEYQLPNTEMYEEYCHDTIDELMTSQRIKIKERSDACDFNRDLRKFLVFDDCFHTMLNEHMKHKTFRCLVSNNRQFYLTLIHTQSFALPLPPIYRTNIDVVFVFRDSNVSNRKRIYELYGGIFESFQDFDRYMTEYTKEPYQCMVIYNAARTSKIKDCVFWYSVDQGMPCCGF
jgi:hypothetical protein